MLRLLALLLALALLPALALARPQTDLKAVPLGEDDATDGFDDGAEFSSAGARSAPVKFTIGTPEAPLSQELGQMHMHVAFCSS